MFTRNLTPRFNESDKDNYKTRRETFKLYYIRGLMVYGTCVFVFVRGEIHVILVVMVNGLSNPSKTACTARWIHCSCPFFGHLYILPILNVRKVCQMDYLDGLAHEKRTSSALAMELRISFPKHSIWIRTFTKSLTYDNISKFIFTLKEPLYDWRNITLDFFQSPISGWRTQLKIVYYKSNFISSLKHYCANDISIAI